MHSVFRQSTKAVKIFSLLLVLLACALGPVLTLGACSSNNTALTSANEGQAASNEGEEAAPEEPAPSLDEVTEGVLDYVREAGLQAGEDSSASIAEMYSSGVHDPYAIFTELRDAGAFEEAAPEGIMVLNYETGKRYTYKSTGSPKCTTFTVKLDLIDPETGEVSTYKKFSSEESHSCSMAGNGIGRNTQVTRAHFNEDMTLMAATLTLEDGSDHIGWIDESGQFTDVSALITSPDSFDGLVQHYKPCFGPNNYLYFQDAGNRDNIKIKRVPLDDLSESAVETVLEDMDYPGVILHPDPDGVVREDGGFGWYYYSADTMNYPAGSGGFYDWISPTECVGFRSTVPEMIFRITLSGEKGVLDWDEEYVPLVPYVDGRENYCPVVSPECDRVAFFSELTSSTDSSPHLYIVSLDGGDPTEVQTTYDFAGSETDTILLTDWC